MLKQIYLNTIQGLPIISQNHRKLMLCAAPSQPDFMQFAEYDDEYTTTTTTNNNAAAT
jgi:hypothetical protein